MQLCRRQLCSPDPVLKDFVIRVGSSLKWNENELCRRYGDGIWGGTTEEVACDRQVYGRYVSIHSGKQLAICEAAVHGFIGGEHGNRPVAQIPQCTSLISHNAPFCNRNLHVCAFLLQNGALWDMCLMHFVVCVMGLLEKYIPKLYTLLNFCWALVVCYRVK